MIGGNPTMSHTILQIISRNYSFIYLNLSILDAFYGEISCEAAMLMRFDVTIICFTISMSGFGSALL